MANFNISVQKFCIELKIPIKDLKYKRIDFQYLSLSNNFVSLFTLPHTLVKN